jgi:hypothetical protein
VLDGRGSRRGRGGPLGFVSRRGGESAEALVAAEAVQLGEGTVAHPFGVLDVAFEARGVGAGVEGGAGGGRFARGLVVEGPEPEATTLGLDGPLAGEPTQQVAGLGRLGLVGARVAFGS